jgi:hypothetical protein
VTIETFWPVEDRRAGTERWLDGPGARSSCCASSRTTGLLSNAPRAGGQESKGYWLVASDGGIFSFADAAYYGSEPGDGTNVDNSVGIEASSSGDGYWVAGADGRVGTFGDATPEGSMLGLGLNKRIVAFLPSLLNLRHHRSLSPT